MSIKLPCSACLQEFDRGDLTPINEHDSDTLKFKKTWWVCDACHRNILAGEFISDKDIDALIQHQSSL